MIDTYIHTYMHAYLQTYMHMHTYTHTDIPKITDANARIYAYYGLE